MDFPSHSSKLATRHANKGDVPPAPSGENEPCISMWQCLTILILMKTTLHQSILKHFARSRQEWKYLMLHTWHQQLYPSIRMIC